MLNNNNNDKDLPVNEDYYAGQINPAQNEAAANPAPNELPAEEYPNAQPQAELVGVATNNYPSAYQRPAWQSSYPTQSYYQQAHPGYGVADGGGQVAPPLPLSQPNLAGTPRKNRGGRWAIFGGIALIVLMAGLSAFLLFGNTNNSTTLTVPASNSTALVVSTTTTAPTASTTAPVSAVSSALTVRQVAEKIRPAVVQITSQQNANLDTTNPFAGSGNSGNGQAVPQQTGIGSGVIYDKAGYILTNFHVIDGADSLLVTLPDGRTFDAKVVGSDQQTDLAVVKVEPNGADLPIAELGDSAALHVGDGVVAIGNALALPGGPTVTSGVVSALDRSVTEPGSSTTTGATSAGPQLYGLVQTDAAINPGNSGGALVDMQGRVIGINTLVAGQAEPGIQAQGIGFAISINQAKDISGQLVAGGKVSHPFLGISYQPLTPALANQFKLNSDQKTGVVLGQVQAGSPAAQAGLKRGDVIISIDGKKLTTESSLGQIINTHKPGDKVKLEVITPQTSGNAQSRTVEVTLAQRTTN